MGPARAFRAVSERFDIPERDLWLRARRERWDERIEGLELEILDMWSLPVLAHTCQQIHLGLALEAATRMGAPIPGFRLGFVPMGTQLLVQLQRTGGPGVLV
jgi:hypothetical protein